MAATDVQKLYVTEREVALMLNRSVAWLKKNVPMIEQSAGFPKVDPVIGLRHREAVEEWARQRNMRKLRPERLNETNRENHNAF